jgi:hypothetical protein
MEPAPTTRCPDYADGQGRCRDVVGAVLGVYFVIKATSDCSECIVLHPVVIVGAALIGIIVASIFLQ